MDWDAVIVRQHDALKRVVASLAAMAGLAIGQSPPLRGVRNGSRSERKANDLAFRMTNARSHSGGLSPAGQRGVSGATVDHPPLSAEPVLGLAGGQTRRPTSPPQEGRSGVATIPRHLHRAVLRLLRPAEAAVRRLVIVFVRGLVVTLPPPRPPMPDPAAAHAALRALGLAVALSPADHACAAAARRAAENGPPPAPAPPAFVN